MIGKSYETTTRRVRGPYQAYERELDSTPAHNTMIVPNDRRGTLHRRASIHPETRQSRCRADEFCGCGEFFELGAELCWLSVRPAVT
jgi:hypothetical protein